MKLGAGFGWVTAAELLGTPAWAQQPARLAVPRRISRGMLTDAALPANRQAGHLPAHARRRVAGRHVRLQADAREDARRRSFRASVRGNIATLDDGAGADVVSRSSVRLRKFQPGGKSGAMISDLMPYTRKIADDICIIRTMHTEHVNHDPASKFLHTGFQIAGRPSGGAWVNYALGSNNQDLPTFIVMSSGKANGVPIDAAAWGSGFLPSHYQGVLFRSGQTAGAVYRRIPDGLTPKDRREHARRHRGRREACSTRSRTIRRSRRS